MSDWEQLQVCSPVGMLLEDMSVEYIVAGRPLTVNSVVEALVDSEVSQMILPVRLPEHLGPQEEMLG
jgi:hypothetical protein